MREMCLKVNVLNEVLLKIWKLYKNYIIIIKLYIIIYEYMCEYLLITYI